MCKAFLYILFTPAQVLHPRLGAACVAVALSQLQQPFRAVCGAVENDVLDDVAQIAGQLIVHRQLTRVDNPHIHTGFNCVVQEYRVNGLAHGIIAAERKRHIGHATGHQCTGKLGFDIPRRFYELNRVVVVFLDAGGNGENIGIKNNVVGIEIQFTDQQIITTLADILASLQVVCLAFFIKRHDHHGCAITLAEACLGEKFFLPGLQADRVDDGLALYTFEPCLNHIPFGRVHHDGNPADIRLRGNQIEKGHHGRLRVQHAFIHIDINDLRAIFYLCARHGQCLVEAAVHNKAFEFGRAGDIAALPHIHEQAVRRDVERFQSAQATGRFMPGQRARCHAFTGMRDRPNVGGCCATATAREIQEAAAGELPVILLHDFWRLIKLTKGIGQAGVQVGTEIAVGSVGEFLYKGPNFSIRSATVAADN